MKGSGDETPKKLLCTHLKFGSCQYLLDEIEKLKKSKPELLHVFKLIITEIDSRSIGQWTGVVSLTREEFEGVIGEEFSDLLKDDSLIAFTSIFGQKSEKWCGFAEQKEVIALMKEGETAREKRERERND